MVPSVWWIFLSVIYCLGKYKQKSWYYPNAGLFKSCTINGMSGLENKNGLFVI